MKLASKSILYAMLFFNSMAVISCQWNKGFSIHRASLVHVHLGEMVSKPGMYWIDPQASFWDILKKCGGKQINHEDGRILGGVTVWRKENDGTLLIRKWWTREVAPETQTVQRLLETERYGRWEKLQNGDRVYFIDQRTIP